MKAVVLVNPHAGRQNILRELEGVKSAFEESGWETELIQTESAEQAAEVIRENAHGQADLLVCCGGDGTLSETADVLLKAGGTTPLGYIPAGTTNDFAAFLGLPREPVKAAQRIVSGEAHPLDAGRFGNRHFIYVASFGAFTQSSYATNQSLKNVLGHLAYVLEGIRELPSLRAYSLRAETVEGEVFEGEYLFGAVSSSTSFGGVVKLDPALVGRADGVFEVTLIKRPKSLAELNGIVGALTSGKFDNEMIDFTHTRGVAFSCKEAMPWSLDGEYDPGGEQVKIEVLPGAIKLRC